MTSPEQEKEIPSPLHNALKLLHTILNATTTLQTKLQPWLPVLAALQQLTKTSQKLAKHTYQFLTDHTDHTQNTQTSPPNALPLELLAELHTGFTELTQAFPEVSTFFLDTEKIDRFLAEILLDPANTLPGHRLLTLLNEQSTRAIGKFVELTFTTASKKDTPSAEATHAFIQRAEQLLDTILQRWIWPLIDPTNPTSTPSPEETP